MTALLSAVFEHLDRVLPTGVRIHGFGVKGDCLSYLRGLEHRISSIDSQAYGTAARFDANRRGVSKTDRLVADHMESWTARQLARRSQPTRALQGELALNPGKPDHRDPWEAAIAQAHREIRDLIEDGSLDHDVITAGWIQEWAADIYRHALETDRAFASPQA